MGSVTTKKGLVESLRQAAMSCQEAQDEIDTLVMDLNKAGAIPEDADVYEQIEAVILQSDGDYTRGYDRQDGGTSIMVFESFTHPAIEIHVKRM